MLYLQLLIRGVALPKELSGDSSECPSSCSLTPAGVRVASAAAKQQSWQWDMQEAADLLTLLGAPLGQQLLHSLMTIRW